MTTVRNTPQLDAWRAMSALVDDVNDRLDEALRREAGLALSWFELLDVLHREGGGMRMSQLADLRLISRSTVTRLVERVEQAGLVERKICDSDRRGIVVILTEDGTESHRRALPTINAVVDNRFGHLLSDEDANQMIETLGAMCSRQLDQPAGLASAQVNTEVS